MSKEAISGGYIKEMMAIHGHKQRPDIDQDAKVMITGAAKMGSIGSTIHNVLSGTGHDVTQCNLDLRHCLPVDMQGYDTLIMCHGVTHMDWIEEASMGDIDEIVDVNLTASIHTVRHFVQQTIASQQRKCIIGIGSMAYKSVLNGSSAYCASKAGLAHYLKCAAWELAPKGYDVYCVHPSNVTGTPMTEETIKGLQTYRGIAREEAEAYWASGMVRSSPLTVDELALFVLRLVNNDFPYLSGSNIEFGGGQR